MTESRTADDPRVHDRRSLLSTALGLAAGVGLGGCSKGETDGPGAAPSGEAAAPEGFPFGLDETLFENHGLAPLTLETKRALLDGLVTPTDRIFVRNNLGPPPASVLEDRDAWCIEVTGVANPGTLSLGDLKTLGRATVACVLQCSGNGRRFFEHGASGSQWGVGAAANVIWTGVPLRAVIEHLGGAVDGARFATVLGGDPLPEGLDPKLRIERSVPLEAAIERGILAWELNGAPLDLVHGAPLRLVMPGYYGVNQVKHAEGLALTAEESDHKIQAKSYRVRPIGESSDPSQPSMWEMNVKSWITSPLESAATGETYVTGVAFSGAGPATRVEVSTDGGTTWNDAEFVGPDLGAFAWRTFAFPWKAAAGTHTLMCRATDTSGATQPELRVENERGYRHNGWRDHGVQVTVS